MSSIIILIGRHHPETFAAWSVLTAVNNDIKHLALNSQKKLWGESSFSIKEWSRTFSLDYIKLRKVNRPIVGPIKLKDGTLCDDLTAMASHFVNCFLSMYQSSIPLHPSPHQMCDNIIDQIEISYYGVYNLLLNLDPNTGMGEDRIHSRRLK